MMIVKESASEVVRVTFIEEDAGIIFLGGNLLSEYYSRESLGGGEVICKLFMKFLVIKVNGKFRRAGAPKRETYGT